MISPEKYEYHLGGFISDETRFKPASLVIRISYPLDCHANLSQLGIDLETKGNIKGFVLSHFHLLRIVGYVERWLESRVLPSKIEPEKIVQEGGLQEG